MAGRGRGRGRRMMTFNVEAVGINKGDTLPPSTQQPTPLFPALEHKPLPLSGGEEAEYLLALKQEFRGAMRTLPFFIQPDCARTGQRSHADVERYSDKYHSSEQADALTSWMPDWKRFPKELRLRVRKTPKKGVSKVVVVTQRAQAEEQKKAVEEKKEVLLKLETLQGEEQQSSEDEEQQEKKEEDQEPEEEYDEEELEEETDYIMSYFDNGEDFGGDSDDNVEEAVY
ncbi:DNA-directed RNA polymerase III subunit RPC7-like [Nerophis lumbriciformis]|uniref:DNA-directed RNA polymerase III subunit RPC7-like n=1 Tax=Nerophis lumbriciformis TaxID=546530 RepID=UPI002AE06420|nr:RNA polymerase III subunit GL b [Nerophis lumbriciformis]